MKQTTQLTVTCSKSVSKRKICACLFYFLQLKLVVVTMYTFINSASTCMYLLLKYNGRRKGGGWNSREEICSIFNLKFLLIFTFQNEWHFHFSICKLVLFSNSIRKKLLCIKINMIAMDQMDPAYPSLEVSFLIKMFASNLQLY